MCNCGSGTKTRQFEHVAPDGTKTVVATQGEAVSMTRKQGGTWKIKQ